VILQNWSTFENRGFHILFKLLLTRLSQILFYLKQLYTFLFIPSPLVSFHFFLSFFLIFLSIFFSTFSLPLSLPPLPLSLSLSFIAFDLSQTQFSEGVAWADRVLERQAYLHPTFHCYNSRLPIEKRIKHLHSGNFNRIWICSIQSFVMEAY